MINPYAQAFMIAARTDAPGGNRTQQASRPRRRLRLFGRRQARNADKL